MSTIGGEYLKIYAKLDLDRKEDRRIALRTLEDFYGRNLVFVTKYRLEEGNTDSSNIGVLWGRVKGELNAILPDFSVPEEFQGMIHELKSHRDRVSHDYTEGVSNDDLDDFRDSAEKWRSWIQDQAKHAANQKTPSTDKHWLLKRVNSILENYRSLQVEIDYIRDIKEYHLEDLEGIKRSIIQIEDTSKIKPGKLGNLHSKLDHQENTLETLQESEEFARAVKDTPKEERTHHCKVKGTPDPEDRGARKILFESQGEEDYHWRCLLDHPESGRGVTEILEELEKGDEVEATIHLDPVDMRYHVVEDVEILD